MEDKGRRGRSGKEVREGKPKEKNYRLGGSQAGAERREGDKSDGRREKYSDLKVRGTVRRKASNMELKLLP